MYLISVLSASRLKELIKRLCVSEVIRYSLPYLSIPSIEKLGFKIVDIIDLSWLTFVTIPTTYEFLSMTRSFSLRLRFSPPEIIYSFVIVLNIIEVLKISYIAASISLVTELLALISILSF